MVARRLRTLVVEDNQEYLRTCVRWLESQPEIELAGAACSGEDAIDAVRRVRPDVVLMDLAMPGMGGLDATRLIKADAGAPLIVIMSIWDSQVARGEAGLVGADGFVAKPQITTQLLPLLRRLAGSGPQGGPGGAPDAGDARRPGVEDGPAVPGTPHHEVRSPDEPPGGPCLAWPGAEPVAP